MSPRRESIVAAQAPTLTDPLVLLTTGLLLELVAVIAAVLPGRPLGPAAPLVLVLGGLFLATFGAVGLARED